MQQIHMHALSVPFCCISWCALAAALDQLSACCPQVIVTLIDNWKLIDGVMPLLPSCRLPLCG